MHPELAEAIELFRHDQELALAYLHGELGIPVPQTAFDWAKYGYACVAAVKSKAASDEVTLYHHGTGIEVIHLHFHIDFDYGRLGQCDCFDQWRLSLHRHLRLKLPSPVNDPRPIEHWLNEAALSGELLPVADSYHMFYHPRFRSNWQPTSRGS